MTTYRDLLDRELAEITRLTMTPETAGAADAEGTLATLRRVTELHEALQQARQVVADMAPQLVHRALQQGVDQAVLAGKPYTPTVVRRLARAAGIPPLKPGPRRRGVTARVSDR